MRVDTLHRHMVVDALALHPALLRVLPVNLPAHYEHQASNLITFLKRLNDATEPFGIHHEHVIDAEVSPGLLFNTGLWLSKTELPENGSDADIRVIWHANKVTKRIVWTAAAWHRRRYYVWDRILHELIHRHQDRHRGHEHDRVYPPRSTIRDIKASQEYLGSCDEIETHAHATAVELAVWWSHLTMREAIRESLSFSGRLVTPTYNYYHETFRNSPGHPAMQQFHRKLTSWYTLIKKNPDFYTSTIQLPNLIS